MKYWLGATTGFWICFCICVLFQKNGATSFKNVDVPIWNLVIGLTLCIGSSLWIWKHGEDK